MPKFTRAELRRIIGENCTDEIENALINLHLGVVDALKDELDTAKAETGKIADLKQQIADLTAEKGFKEKYEKEHKDFEDYKKSISDKETLAAKETAVKSYFEKKGITGGNLEIAMRGAREEINSAELDGEKIKDTKALDALVAGTFKGLIVSKGTQGANTPNPPAGNGQSGTLTRAEIYKRDDKGRYVMDATARQQALAKLVAEESQN